ncbi:MAG TPA: ABC transporter permease [Solirubrobacteraceae bacterium]|nr:ABC transporter permease [Solirubrobacteraceae bacterium]
MEAATTELAPLTPARRETRIEALLREAGELTRFTGQSIAALVRTPRYTAEILRQAAILVRGTTPLMFVMNAFFGCSIMSFAFFFLRSIGASDFAGVPVAFADLRVGAPLMFGYVFASKVCCGFVAEIGAMKINEELDAYESNGVDPLRYVVGTRILAVAIFLPIGCAVSLVGELAGNYLLGVVVLHGISGQGFLQLFWGAQGLSDQFLVFVGQAVLALSVAVVACFYGLRTAGSSAAVGDSVARSLVVNLVLVHLYTGFFVVLFYGVNLHMSIGG